jgi:hypothetical protein
MITMFRRKTSASSTPVAVLPELTVLNDPATELERKLALEVRLCPTCSYQITNPMNDRCPRCFTVVPLSEHTNCGECSHQGNCTYVGDTK